MDTGSHVSWHEQSICASCIGWYHSTKVCIQFWKRHRLKSMKHRNWDIRMAQRDGAPHLIFAFWMEIPLGCT